MRGFSVYLYLVMSTQAQIGSFRCILLKAWTFRVDGGAMFGIVPKALWKRKSGADAENRVPLAVNPLLILGPDHNLLVDPGIGTRELSRFKEHFAIREEEGLERRLLDHGVRAGEIDVVINTHLHWDHSGANLTLSAEGGLVPTFPRAAYLVQRGEWEAACTPNALTRESYTFQADTTLIRSGQLETLDGDSEIVPGVRVLKTPGHTPFHQSVLIESGGEALLYLGDLIPTRAHLPLPYITSLDLDPVLTLRTKQRILREAREKGWRLAFCHESGEEVIAPAPEGSI